MPLHTFIEAVVWDFFLWFRHCFVPISSDSSSSTQNNVSVKLKPVTAQSTSWVSRPCWGAFALQASSSTWKAAIWSQYLSMLRINTRYHISQIKFIRCPPSSSQSSVSMANSGCNKRWLRGTHLGKLRRSCMTSHSPDFLWTSGVSYILLLIYTNTHGRHVRSAEVHGLLSPEDCHDSTVTTQCSANSRQEREGVTVPRRFHSKIPSAAELWVPSLPTDVLATSIPASPYPAALQCPEEPLPKAEL